MITVVVQFDLPRQLGADEARTSFEAATAQFQNVEGLVRKYFLLSEDGKRAGGVYLWTREDLARQAHRGFRAEIKERFGAEPTMVFFRTPVIVDNAKGTVETG